MARSWQTVFEITESIVLMGVCDLWFESFCVHERPFNQVAFLFSAIPEK